MFIFRYLLYFIPFYLSCTQPQINLYYTNENIDDGQQLPHDCLRFIESADHQYEIIYFCLSEFESTWKIENHDSISNWTFDELKRQNITHEDLYFWSAPIDLIEDYQVYLNQTNNGQNSSLSDNTYFNCTWPKFGPSCQYEFVQMASDNLSLQKMIGDFFHTRFSNRKPNFTCYIQLQCTRESKSYCLQWEEICDGEVQCWDGGEDEKNCWQIEINDCQSNEYRCQNGECIPKSFYADYLHIDCRDQSDEIVSGHGLLEHCVSDRTPIIDCVDRTYKHLLFSSSSDYNRLSNLKQLSSAITIESSSRICQNALRCLFDLTKMGGVSCYQYCSNYPCVEIINETCPDLLVIRIHNFASDGIHYLFQKTNIHNMSSENIGLLYICYANSRYDTFYRMNYLFVHNNSKCLFSQTITNDSSYSFTSMTMIMMKLKNEYFVTAGNRTLNDRGYIMKLFV